MNPLESKTILSCLKGEQLSAVTFIQDYVQLHFDGPFLTAYVWPHILNENGSVTPKVSGYRDTLCELIGKIVVKAFEMPDDRLAIEFANGAVLEVSLRESDREGPEAAVFREQAGKGLRVW